MNISFALALLSGAPALVAQVVWTRQIGLACGGQVEAISVVLVAFFTGLAAGSRVFGRIADRISAPLRLYAALEGAVGVGIVASAPLLTWLGALAGTWSQGAALVVGAIVIAPIAFAMGGTLPPLVRASAAGSDRVRASGWLLGLNTAGAVVGVGLSLIAIPSLGLRASLLVAGAGSLLLATSALIFGRGAREPGRTGAASARVALERGPLVAAAFAGVATLAYEVMAARAAGLRLGSSLYGWGAVLALYLTGLALGSAGIARRAARSEDPRRDLGWIELAAALWVMAGLQLYATSPAEPSTGLSLPGLMRVALGVLPAALLMGAAFPLFVRLAGRGVPRIAADAGHAFGTTSAANTAGGVAGALAAPFLLLPLLGLEAGVLASAAVNALLGAAFLAGSRAASARALAAGGLALCLCVGIGLSVRTGESARGHLLYAADGAQASAAVVQVRGHRELLVDGDPEASTAGAARDTEELLAVLPLLLHPAPELLLEIGLGSGISLATAARAPLARLDCVEISRSVIDAAPWFRPHNDGIRDERVHIVHGDGRAFLLRHRDAYDVILANTVHPWSLGATGLYSREYFERVQGALRPGGIAVQWVPLARIGRASVESILRTFFAVFTEGAAYWTGEDLLVVGSDLPVPFPDAQRLRARPGLAPVLARLDLSSPLALAGLRLAAAATVREALPVQATGAILHDDRPVLERSAASGRRLDTRSEMLPLLVELSGRQAARDPEAIPLDRFLRSLEARFRDDTPLADRLEGQALGAGLVLAHREVRARRASGGRAALERGNFPEAVLRLREVERRGRPDAALDRGLGLALLRTGDMDGAVAALRRSVEREPESAEAWNLLGAALGSRGDDTEAAQAFDAAVRVEPFFPEALANAGVLALDRGDRERARQLLERLRASRVGRPTRFERRLRERLATD